VGDFGWPSGMDFQPAFTVCKNRLPALVGREGAQKALISPASPQSLAFASSPSFYAVMPSRLNPVNSLMLSAAPAAGESIQITYTATHLTNIYTDIEGITRQNPCVVTWSNHPLTSNDKIDIRGITLPSWTALNGKYQVTVKTVDTFTVPVDSSGYPLCNMLRRRTSGRSMPQARSRAPSMSCSWSIFHGALHAND
jgi:hypothetical protein